MNRTHLKFDEPMFLCSSSPRIFSIRRPREGGDPATSSYRKAKALGSRLRGVFNSRMAGHDDASFYQSDFEIGSGKTCNMHPALGD
jgi:hypothetical protein